jgi:hypothetical protein
MALPRPEPPDTMAFLTSVFTNKDPTSRSDHHRTSTQSQGREQEVSEDDLSSSVPATLIIHVPVLIPSVWWRDVVHHLVFIPIRGTAICLSHLFLLLSPPPLRRRGAAAVIFLALAPGGRRRFALAWHVKWNGTTGRWVRHPFYELLEKIEHLGCLDCVLSGKRRGVYGAVAVCMNM